MSVRQAGICGVVVLALMGATAGRAAAQTFDYFGLVTPHLGVTAGGDAQDAALTPGVSVAVFETSGWGVEADVAYARGFDGVRFGESSAATYMVNAVWAAQRGRVRPFGVGGLGLLRTRVCAADCIEPISHVDFGLNAGGGLQVPVGEFFFMRGDIRYVRALQEHPELGLGGKLHFWRASVGFSVWWPVM